MKRRRNICIKIIVAKGEEAQGKTGVLRLPVKFLLGGSETGVELHVSCVSDCAGGGGMATVSFAFIKTHI